VLAGVRAHYCGLAAATAAFHMASEKVDGPDQPLNERERPDAERPTQN
jgi:hypothetical protein